MDKFKLGDLVMDTKKQEYILINIDSKIGFLHCESLEVAKNKYDSIKEMQEALTNLKKLSWQIKNSMVK